MMTLILTCSILSFFISLPALAISLYTLVEIKAFKRSTHKIEFMPLPDISNKQNKEFLEGFQPSPQDEFLV